MVLSKQPIGKAVLRILALCLLQLSFVMAQPAEVPSHYEPYIYDSQLHSLQSGNEAVLADDEVIRIPDVPWIRLTFSESHLGAASYMIITSLKDGHWQRLDPVSIDQWQNTSAYFNGDAVMIELYVAPGDQDVRYQINEVIVGEWVGPVESQCGPVDDRIQTTNDAVGRLDPIGCTGWTIANGKYVTAGHCAGASSNILQFRVPPSLPGGTTQNSAPEDQYVVDQSSWISTNGGIGNDWGVYAVFDNSNTGLQPIEAYGVSYFVVQDLTPDSIRITGYGVDTGVDNQTLQTHIGPNAGSSGNTMRYVTDTEGGNSGSPVIDEVTGFAVGVHTHGGCSTAGTGNNNGTSAFHPAFWAALDINSVFLPTAPAEFAAYSDYNTPTSIALDWQDPTTLVSGDTLEPGLLEIMIRRDGVLIDSIVGGTEVYVDNGLVDGTEYTYEITAKIDTIVLESQSATATWIAGGSPVPSAPTGFSVAGEQDSVVISWTNPAVNVDGTPMDDFSEINLYINGQLETSFTRSAADTGQADSETFFPSTPGFYDYQVAAVDNESPANESDLTVSLGTPLSMPLVDQFDVAGEPNPGIWINSNADVNDRASSPPSGDLALNLNGKPNGEDIVDMKPLDLSGAENSAAILKYAYQPQGNGNAPEVEDSLRVYLKNDAGDWILVRAYPGEGVKPFTVEVLEIDSLDAGSGSFFHGQFQVRFRSTGGANAVVPNDDWFVDDVELRLNPSTGVDVPQVIPVEFALKQNYPNPFNPSTTISFALPQRSSVRLVIFNMLGQQVRQLLQDSRDAGTHEVVWDGRNDIGNQVASGTYIYRLVANSEGSQAYQMENKMILLK